jgi:quercetin dioxygenase-like cupin family protein
MPTSKSSIEISPTDMERTRVARFKNLKGFDLAFVDALLPNGRKQNLKVIGKGVVENPAMTPPISESHGFTVSYIKVPPGGGANLHSHRTAEIFIPMNGKLIVYFNSDGQDEIELDPWDTISVPTDVMRGFRNPGDQELVVLAMVGGDSGGGSVTWHDDVLGKARDTGLAVDEKGNLVKLDNFKMPVHLEGKAVL